MTPPVNEEMIPAESAANRDPNRNPDGTYAKGNNGNPGGRPKREWTWASLLEQATEIAQKDGKLKKEVMAQMLVDKAAKGDVRAFEAIMDRMDGKPRQAVDLVQRDPDEVVIIG